MPLIWHSCKDHLKLYPKLKYCSTVFINQHQSQRKAIKNKYNSNIVNSVNKNTYRNCDVSQCGGNDHFVLTCEPNMSRKFHWEGSQFISFLKMEYFYKLFSEYF